MKSALRRVMVAVIFVMQALVGPLVCRAQSSAGKSQDPTVASNANAQPEVASSSAVASQPAPTAPQDQGASTPASASPSQPPAQAPAAVAALREQVTDRAVFKAAVN